MPPRSASSRGRGRRLIDRTAECTELDSLLDDVRRGEIRSLVIRGEAGVGKTALLEYLTERAGSAFRAFWRSRSAPARGCAGADLPLYRLVSR